MACLPRLAWGCLGAWFQACKRPAAPGADRDAGDVNAGSEPELQPLRRRTHMRLNSPAPSRLSDAGSGTASNTSAWPPFSAISCPALPPAATALAIRLAISVEVKVPPVMARLLPPPLYSTIQIAAWTSADVWLLGLLRISA